VSLMNEASKDAVRAPQSSQLLFDFKHQWQVTDVWSAVALKALFEALVAEGCVVVLTSNRWGAGGFRRGVGLVLRCPVCCQPPSNPET
jgi:predicted ATPase